MNFSGFDFENAAEIYDEHSALTKGTRIDISGLSHQIIKEKKTVQWPYNATTDVETKRLFTDNIFYTASKKAIIHHPPDTNNSQLPCSDFPLILTTGRIRDQWHTMSKTGKVNKLNTHISTAFLEIHPADAAARNITENTLVEVTSRFGQVRVNTQITDTIKQGVVFLPMHWGKIVNSDLNRANNVTGNLVDPISKEPDFKFTAVEVCLYKKQKQKIVIIGAGAGACGFIKKYRQLNTNDQITVFSKENLPFYNRVLLPDYISGALGWQNLVKISGEQEEELNIDLKKGISIVNINRQSKIVEDSQGNTHSYDIVILATGSRPFLPKDIPTLPGIFTLRSRMDADAFKSHLLPEKGKIIIVGGGLLGIELAASLCCEMGLQATIIQRTGRLMARQLDPLGSQLLHEILVEKNIEILYNDEIDRYIGSTGVEGVKLKSGLYLAGQAVVIAAGTQPNTELAGQAGITCRHGVVVNEYLQTSDTDIYAIGEIAEYKGQMFGITAAAEQQAEIAAAHLYGDISTPYGGSLLMNILKVHGADLCSMGLAECPDKPGYEEVIFIDKAKKYYKKCIIYQDRLVGAILIGDKSEFLEFKALIENKTELSEKRLQLLRSGTKTEPVKGKLVCSCANVGQGNIEQKINEGCKDMVQLCQLSGAGMGCGSCRPEVQKILETAMDI